MTATAPRAVETGAPPPLPPGRGRDGVVAWLAQTIGSMKLSVYLLLLLALLTWLGTLAQAGRSTHDVQREYFESWLVIAELPLSVWGRPLFENADGTTWVLRIPLPGAYPVMGVLFVNLLVGGFLRMKWQVRNLGILITHTGIVVLLVAGFVKLHYSYAGALSLFEGGDSPNRIEGRVYESSRFVSFHDFELALSIDRGDHIEERLVPEDRLWGARGDGVVTVRGAGLPFTLQVHHWVDFAKVLPKGPMVRTTMPVVDGVFLEPDKWPAGKQPEADKEIAGCYVKVLVGSEVKHEAILYGLPLMPFDGSRYPYTFQIDGTRYGLDLRHVVYDLPYRVRLDKFQKSDHPGTSMARDFRSFVTVLDGQSPQQAQVFMNNPLRKGEYVLYQTSWGPPMGGPPYFSVFEVSYNPSDAWPKIACFVIAIGLIVHFASKLERFLRSSARVSLQS